MYLFTILSALTAITGVSVAQSINPDSVPFSERAQWCTQQKTSCPLLCLQFPGNNAATTANSCDPTTLSYSCVCANGQSPNASQYSQTIPYFICTEADNQCVANCGQDNTCANACRADNPCGAKNPTRVNTSTISSTMSQTVTGSGSAASGSGSGTQFATLGASTTAAGGSKGGSGASQLALDMGNHWGMAVILGGVFAGVALML